MRTATQHTDACSYLEVQNTPELVTFNEMGSVARCDADPQRSVARSHVCGGVRQRGHKCSDAAARGGGVSQQRRAHEEARLRIVVKAHERVATGGEQEVVGVAGDWVLVEVPVPHNA